MDDIRFKDGKMPRFRDVFAMRAKASVDLLTACEFQPRLDDTGDDMESAISQLSDLWNMWFENDGQLDFDGGIEGVADDLYLKWWQDFLDGSGVIYADDVRYSFLTDDAADSIP